MTPEARDAIATVRRKLEYDDGAYDDALAALSALEETIDGEAEVRRNHLALIGQLNVRIEALEDALRACDEQAKTPLLVLTTIRKEHGDTLHRNFVRDIDCAIEGLRAARAATTTALTGKDGDG